MLRPVVANNIYDKLSLRIIGKPDFCPLSDKFLADPGLDGDASGGNRESAQLRHQNVTQTNSRYSCSVGSEAAPASAFGNCDDETLRQINQFEKRRKDVKILLGESHQKIDGHALIRRNYISLT